MQRRLQESQDVAMQNSQERIGLVSQGTPSARRCHGARWPKPSGNKASPREWCTQGCGTGPSRGETHPRAASGGEEKLSGKGTSDQTECGEKRSPEVTASSHAQLLERKVRAEPTAGMWKGVRLSVRPVTMQLTDDRQSRDGSSRANTALG